MLMILERGCGDVWERFVPSALNDSICVPIFKRHSIQQVLYFLEMKERNKMLASRRSIILGTTAAAGLAFAQPSLAREPKTTVIYAPHPDDEILYLGGYVDFSYRMGDRLILVAVTDGGATKAKAAAWSVEELCQIRINEQTAAWRIMTRDRGDMIRLGLRDGSGAALTDVVRATAESLEGPNVEHYVAANDGQSADHVAVTKGLRTAKVRVARFANFCTTKNGYLYQPKDPSTLAKAAGSYVAVGQRSVPSMFKSLESFGYASRVRP